MGKKRKKPSLVARPITPEMRKAIEAEEARWQEIYRPLREAIEESSRITAEDLAITINARG